MASEKANRVRVAVNEMKHRNRVLTPRYICDERKAAPPRWPTARHQCSR